MSCTDQDDAEKFLERFLEDLPNPLGTEDPLPVSPLSRKVSLQEVKGESLDVGLRLLSDRFVIFMLTCRYADVLCLVLNEVFFSQ